MSGFLNRLRHTAAQVGAAVERLLSPEVLLADRRLAKKQIAVPAWRQRSNPLEKVVRAWNRLPAGVHHGLAMTFILCVLAFAVQIPSQAYEIKVVHAQTGEVKKLGVMRDSSYVDLWVDQIIADNPYSQDYDLFIYPSVSVQPVWWSGTYTNPQNIKQELRASVQVLTEASIIQIADKASLPVVNAHAANQVLDNVSLYYIEDKDAKEITALTTEFAEEINVIRQPIKPEEIISISEATDFLLQGSEKQRNHVVQAGDTLWDIAMSLADERPGLDVDEALEQLLEVNPEGLPQQNEIVRLPSEHESLLTVKMEETIEVKEPIDFDTETRYSDDLFRYETEIVQYGVRGERIVQYRVTTENGVVTNRVKITERVSVEPIPQIEMRGTKMPNDRGTGSLIWPLYGILTDGFGWRDLGYHRAQDISSGGYGTIVASDSGIVTQSGWDNSGLGYCITIDHRDGRVTRYAHCSQLLVSVGEGVTQGQAIGIEGNTGFSFGNHLHFELIIDGVHVDPLYYLGY